MNQLASSLKSMSVNPKSTRRRRRRDGYSKTLRLIAIQSRPGSSATNNTIVDDFRRKAIPTSFNVHPPRSLGNQVFWARYSAQAVVSTSTTAIFESNYNFALSGFVTSSQITSLSGVFDQFALYCVICNIANNSPEGGTGVIPQVYTALDFDNTINLGSIGGISEFESCNVTSIAPGNSVSRTVMPSLSASAFSSSLGNYYPALLQRSWVDLAYPSTSYYGFRSIVNNTPGAAVQLDYTFTLIVAFRNTV